MAATTAGLGLARCCSINSLSSVNWAGNVAAAAATLLCGAPTRRRCTGPASALTRRTPSATRGLAAECCYVGGGSEWCREAFG